MARVNRFNAACAVERAASRGRLAVRSLGDVLCCGGSVKMRPNPSPKKRILTAKHAEYAEKWNSFAYFVCSAVLWPFYFGSNAQFLAAKCKEAAETLNHGFHGWHGWGKGQDHETTGPRDYRTGAKRGEGAPEVRSRRSEVRGQSSEIS